MADDEVEYEVPAKIAKYHSDHTNFADVVMLTDNIVMFPNRTIGQHRNIYEGEVRSSVYGIRQCAIKFATLSEQNLKEAEILTKLGSHTNIVAIIQSGTYCDICEDHVYIALHKCHHENLRQYLSNRKTEGIEFDLNQAVDFAKQMISGVMYIHDNNIIHLDLKPSNILISQDLCLIKIADFGLSVVVKSSKSKIFYKQQFGTNGYRPIESFGNAEISQRSDIFSLGTSLYHLLSNGGEVFGCDEHSFLHNLLNDVIDTTGLLVRNPCTTEHLIKCMICTERRRRPTIWEVSDHPCWSGLEVECDFECTFGDELDDSSAVETASREDVMVPDIERERAFLKRMREMGFNRKPTMIVFDHFSKHLHRFHEESSSMEKINKYPDDVTNWSFSAASYGEHIYVFCKDRSVYRLEYCDVTAQWERMKDWIGDHGDRPLVIMSSEAIFVIGGSYDSYSSYSRHLTKASRSVSKFNISLNQWERLEDKPTASIGSALLCNREYLCSFGGLDNSYKPTMTAERMSLVTMEWSRISDMNCTAGIQSAAECKERIYVVGSSFDGATTKIEVYDPKVDQWSEVQQREDLYPAYILRTFFIESDLFVIGDNRVLKYDVENDKLSVVMSYCDEILNVEAVLVQMSK